MCVIHYIPSLTLVAEEIKDSSTMSKCKPIKVPTMRKLQPYVDWKKEIEVWRINNTILDVDKKLQAGFLFQSLEGLCRDAVRSELSVADLTDKDGVEKILSSLDSFYQGNEVQNSYKAIDDLMCYKRNKDDNLETFVMKFQVMINKVKASGTVLSQGVLGYALLKSACLPEEKHDMIRVTCSELSFQNVRNQLEKIGFPKSQSTDHKFSSSLSTTSKVKVEDSFFAKDPAAQSNDSWSSDDDTNGGNVFYSKFPHQNVTSNSKCQMNSANRFGFIRACSFCKCVYHWMLNCPYAPQSVKNNLKTKDAPGKVSKPL